MSLLLTILCGLFILFGIAGIFTSGTGSFLASIICIGSGMYAYDQHSFVPLVIGFAGLWVLRLLGLENR